MTKPGKMISDHGPSGWIFFMAFIGALVYFVHQSVGIIGFFIALLKAIVWPAYLVYALLSSLGV